MKAILRKHHALIYLFIIVSLASCTYAGDNVLVIFQTEFGDFTIEVYVKEAPLTATNFLRYVDEDRLKSATFYRIVRMDNQPQKDIKIEVIQGGLYEDSHPQALPPIQHETTLETGILHTDGVISLARNEPGTATCEFFICIGDQASLDYGGMRNPDGQGFAAFGKVVSGMDVVRRIHQIKAEDQFLDTRIEIFKIFRENN